MKHIRKLNAIIAISVMSMGLTSAQTAGSASQRFEKWGLAFDYPVGWTLVDNSALGLQSVTIAPADKGTQIIVTVERKPNRSCDFQAENRNITSELLKQVTNQVHPASPVRTSAVKTTVGLSDAEGVGLQGVVNRKQVTAEVYSVRLNGHFVRLIYIRNDEDERAQPGWDLVRTTMNLDKSMMSFGVLNPRAVVLPKPSYPPLARASRIGGTVVVQVEVDERGNVTSARGVAGDPLLLGVSVDAARGAKFSPPKFCGEPLRVSGVLTYNFVAQ